MTKKVYDRAFKKTIISLYESGKTVNELCSEFNISISSGLSNKFGTNLLDSPHVVDLYWVADHCLHPLPDSVGH